MVFKLYAWLVKQRNNVMFLLSSLKTLTNFKDCSVSRIKILCRLSFTLIGWISPAYIHGRLSEQFSGSPAAFETNFTVTGGFRKAETTLWKWLLEGFSQLVIRYKHAETISDFFHKKTAKNCISAHSKVPVWFLGPSNKIFISWHWPSESNKKAEKLKDWLLAATFFCKKGHMALFSLFISLWAEQN
jgi:hypothetical protein